MMVAPVGVVSPARRAHCRSLQGVKCGVLLRPRFGPRAMCTKWSRRNTRLKRAHFAKYLAVFIGWCLDSFTHVSFYVIQSRMPPGRYERRHTSRNMQKEKEGGDDHYMYQYRTIEELSLEQRCTVFSSSLFRLVAHCSLA